MHRYWSALVPLDIHGVRNREGRNIFYWIAISLLGFWVGHLLQARNSNLNNLGGRGAGIEGLALPSDMVGVIGHAHGRAIHLPEYMDL